jgi:hypothetical protein
MNDPYKSYGQRREEARQELLDKIARDRRIDEQCKTTEKDYSDTIASIVAKIDNNDQDAQCTER